MKKILTLMLAGLMIFTLVACGGSEPQKVTLVIEDSGIYGEYTMEADGDVVHTITQITTMETTGYTEEQFDIINDSVEQYKAIYDAIEGVEYDVAVNETAMVETIKIDVSNEDTINALSEQGLLPVEGEGKISLEKTIANMEEQGWTIKE